jgi:hypothetical protein
MSFTHAILRIVGGLAAYAVAVLLLTRWLGLKMGLVFGVMLAPVFVILIILPGVMNVFQSGHFAIKGLVYRRWHGRFHAFNDIQVRVLEEGGTLWFVGADLARALRREWKDHVAQAYPDTECRSVEDDEGEPMLALSAAGIRRWLGASHDRDALRAVLWAEREVLAPWNKRRERAQLETAKKA